MDPIQDTPHPSTALKKLTMDLIKQMKTFQNPPVNVKMVMSSVLAALGQQETWQIGQRVTGDKSFLKKLRDYDCDAVHPQILTRLENYVKLESFDPQVLSRQSLAASELANWVILLVLWQKTPHHLYNVQQREQTAQSADSKREQAEQLQMTELNPDADAKPKFAYRPPNKQKIPIQQTNKNRTREQFSEEKFDNLDTVPAHLRPVVRRMIEEQVQMRMSKEITNLNEQMTQTMASFPVNSLQQLEFQAFQQRYVEGYRMQPPPYMGMGHPSDFAYNPHGYMFDQAHHQNYYQGHRYSSPQGRQRKYTNSFKGGTQYMNVNSFREDLQPYNDHQQQ